MIKKPKLPITYIEWEDSQANNGWRMPNETEDTPALIRSVGIIVHENKHFVAISTSKGDTAFMDTLSIPRSAIRVMKRVRLK